MSCVGKLLVQQKVLADDLKLAKLEERGTEKWLRKSEQFFK